MVRDVGEHEGDVVGQAIGEHSSQSGESVAQVTSVTQDSTISEDENCSDGFSVLLDLSRNTLVEFVVLSIALLGEPRCVEDAKLERMLRLINRV